MIRRTEHNFLGLPTFALNALSGGIFFFSICLGIKMIKTPELSLKVANAQLVTSSSADRLATLAIDSSAVEEYRAKNRLKLPEHITRFDSQHEFKVYLRLCWMYGEHRIKRQYPIEVIPPGRCYPKGKHWKVDFAIATSWSTPKISHYVEAKGALLPEFVNTLVQLEIAQPDIFENLSVVFGRSIPTENKVVHSLLNQYYVPYFCTLEELKQLTHLPSAL